MKEKRDERGRIEKGEERKGDKGRRCVVGGKGMLIYREKRRKFMREERKGC